MLFVTPPPLCSSSLYSPVTLSFITSVHYVIMASVPLLPCLLLLLPLMSLWLLLHYVIMASVPYVFFYVKYFYELTNLSRNSKQKIGQYLPFLSRTFREEFVTIKNTIVYKIKQRRQNSGNHKFIYGRSKGKEVKERKIRYEKREFVYIFRNKALFLPYSSHLTS